MNTYYAVNGQSLYDICLNTYGVLDYIVKLMLDNNINSLGYVPISGQQFAYDTALVADEQVMKLNYVYATSASDIAINNTTNFNSNFDENFD